MWGVHRRACGSLVLAHDEELNLRKFVDGHGEDQIEIAEWLSQTCVPQPRPPLVVHRCRDHRIRQTLCSGPCLGLLLRYSESIRVGEADANEMRDADGRFNLKKTALVVRPALRLSQKRLP
jgi:hypothetical protein